MKKAASPRVLEADLNWHFKLKALQAFFSVFIHVPLKAFSASQFNKKKE
jgi:hypothetical protein